MEDEFRRIIHATALLVGPVLPGGNINFANLCWCEYPGLGVDGAGGSGWQFAIHLEDLSAVLGRWYAPLNAAAISRFCAGRGPTLFNTQSVARNT